MGYQFNPLTGKLDLVGTGGGSATTDASLLTSGTLADARLSSNVVTLTGTQTLTNKSIDAAQLTGTIALARLDPLVAIDNINNNFTAGQTITAPANTSALIASYSVTGANTTPLVNLTGTWNTTGVAQGILLNVTDTASNAASLLADFQVSGTSQFRFTKAGDIELRAPVNHTSFRTSIGFGMMSIRVNSGADNVGIGGTQLIFSSAGNIRWSSTSSITGTGDLFLLRDAANTLAQRNGTNAQAFRLYNTFTDSANFERGFMRWNANTLEIGTEAGGTGTARALTINSANLTVNTNGLFAASFSYYNGCVLATSVQIRNPANQNAWLASDNNNILAIRNGTSAQALNVYSTFTSTSVFERLRIAATADRNQIISESTGGTVRPLEFSSFTSASDPTTANITSGACGVWKNSGSGVVKLWINDAGTMKSVTLA